MPTKTEWVDPDLYIKHNEIEVYHIYKDDDYDQGVLIHHFTTSNSDYNDEFSFDVRELNTWVEPGHPPFMSANFTPEESKALRALWHEHHANNVESNAIKAAIIAAIESGEINND